MCGIILATVASDHVIPVLPINILLFVPRSFHSSHIEAMRRPTLSHKFTPGMVVYVLVAAVYLLMIPHAKQSNLMLGMVNNVQQSYGF